MKQHQPYWRLLALALLLALPAATARGQVPDPAPVVTSPAEDPPVTTHALTADDAETLIDGFLPYALKRGDIAGAVVTIVKDGQILLNKGYGVADRETGQPIDPETTMFRPGSISKLFTWIAVMQQVEAGRLDLDGDVNQYLDFKIPDTYPEPITIRHLMTHTAGFEETVKDLIVLGDKKPPADLGKLLAGHIPARIFKPGTTAAYSNYATALAGYIVQRLSGEPFADYIARHILAPAGMPHSSFAQPLPPELAKLMSKGYESSHDPAQPFEIVNHAPAGALAASGADMGRFMIALLNGGEGLNGRILRPETLAEMQKPHHRPLPGQKLAMGLGFYEQDRNGYRIMGHGGDTVLFHSDLALWLDEGVGLYISMNSTGDGVSPGPIRDELLALIADRYFPAREPAAAPPTETVKRTTPVGGTFHSSRRVESTFMSLTYLFGQGDLVTNEDGTASFSLFLDFAGKPKRWREIAPDRWQEVGTDSLMHTRTDANGRVTTITTDDYPAIFVFQPVPTAINKTWTVPLLGITLFLALFTVLWWPGAALVRRHYAKPHPLSGRPLMADRLVRAASLMVLVSLGGMTAVMTMAITPLMEGTIDWLLRLLQVAGLLAVLGLVPAVWQAWRLWREPAGWWSRIRATLMVLMFLAVLWFFSTYHLISLTLDY